MFGLAILGLGALALFGLKGRGDVNLNFIEAPSVSVEDAMLAADQLAQYLRTVKPNARSKAVIVEYQKRMGGLVVDGIYGPLTRGRMEYLIQQRLDDAQRRIVNG